MVLRKLKNHSVLFGMIFTVASLLACFIFTWVIYEDEIFARMKEYLFDCGVDVMGAFTCAALYYGSMRQEGEGAKTFRALIVLTSAGFVVNALMYFTTGVPGQSGIKFLFVLLSKLIDLILIYFFYLYVRVTLEFEGKLARWADKWFPILLLLESLVILSNCFYPTTFRVDFNGIYHAMPAFAAEDIFLIVSSVITTILIVRSRIPTNQKVAALTFIFFPLFNYITTIGEFGNASNYGMILMSLIVMYCIIFNYYSSILASTQTELNMARDIQASMLPSLFPPFPNRKEFDLYASMDPAKEVGGDFYDFFMIDDDHLGIVIADVSGKGVPAALFMMISKTILQNFATLGIGAEEVLTRANESLCTQNKMDMFVTAWIGILELSTGKLTCANAGHEYPALCRNGKYELFRDRHGFVLGGMKGSKYREYEIMLNKGDKIFVYTDGVPEAKNANSEMFQTSRMMDALSAAANADPEETLRIVRNSVDAFVGNVEQFDDLTMLCLEYKGPDHPSSAEQ